jgi:hypothetical protein
MTTSTVNKKESDKFKDLIGPMDTKLDKIVREQLITARVGLFLTWAHAYGPTVGLQVFVPL